MQYRFSIKYKFFFPVLQVQINLKHMEPPCSKSCAFNGHYTVLHLQWMVSSFLAERGSCKAGCSASHRMVAPSSDFETGSTSLEMEVHVLTLLPPGLEFSWVWPVRISTSSANHLSVGGGLPPVAMHSISRSSPAEAMMWSESSPTSWITISLGFSERKKYLMRSLISGDV